MVTPSVELRAAAKALRQAIAAMAAHEDIRGRLDPAEWRDWFDGDMDMINLASINAFIRLMSPALAEPLASWLEMTAERYEQYPIETPLIVAAVAVARAINGAAS